MRFSDNFVWGAASAAYQIEGGAFEDGKGLSIWDQFSHIPGRTFNGHTGDTACDAYHRAEEDLDLMQKLGIRNYRFSLSWPRIFPDGTVNGNGGSGSCSGSYGAGPDCLRAENTGTVPGGSPAAGLNSARCGGQTVQRKVSGGSPAAGLNSARCGGQTVQRKVPGGSPDAGLNSARCGGRTGQRTVPGGSPAAGLNPAGIAYYDRLVDGCLARGITPWVTLYHWDLPLSLYHRGGWMNRGTAEHFAEYAAYVAAHFKGRVTHYITINEPQCAIGMGMENGLHAPGLHLDHGTLFRCWHNLLLAHGLAARAIREADPSAEIGASSTGALAYLPEQEESKYRKAAAAARPMDADSTSGPGGSIETPEALRTASFRSLPLSQNPGYYFNHQWFFDPVFLGHYPDDPESPWAPFTGSIPKEDLEIISTPIDFAGLNIYNGHGMVQDEAGGFHPEEKYPGYPRTALKWPVTPEVLYWGPRLIYERYGKPVYITENGQSCNDRIFLDGCVHDPDRIDFLHRYLRELKRACLDGIPVQGYFHWSLTDNFEWHSGYDDRFGLIYIDYRNLRRIPKDSALWYAEVIRTNGENI